MAEGKQDPSSGSRHSYGSKQLHLNLKGSCIRCDMFCLFIALQMWSLHPFRKGGEFICLIMRQIKALLAYCRICAIRQNILSDLCTLRFKKALKNFVSSIKVYDYILDFGIIWDNADDQHKTHSISLITCQNAWTTLGFRFSSWGDVKNKAFTPQYFILRHYYILSEFEFSL